MIQTQEHTGKIRVEDYGLAEFMKQVQEQIQKGFTIDFETNEGYPTSFGTLYTCMLNPASTATEPLPEVTPELLDQNLNDSLDQVPAEVAPEVPAKVEEVRIDGRTKAAKKAS
jgi:hypothetical protein